MIAVSENQAPLSILAFIACLARIPQSRQYAPRSVLILDRITNPCTALKVTLAAGPRPQSRQVSGVVGDPVGAAMGVRLHSRGRKIARYTMSHSWSRPVAAFL